MRQQAYKFQLRQPKIERQESLTRQDSAKGLSYTPGNWKSYIPHEISLSSEKRSNRTPSNYNNREANYNYEGHQDDDSRISSILSSRKEQERRRQESAMRKVRELQEKVLPMMKGGRQARDQEEGVWIGWQSKVEQKLLRLQGQVDNMKKEMELVLERRVMELQNKWEERFRDCLKKAEEKS